MKLFTPSVLKSFKTLYILQLRHLLSIENQIVLALPSMTEHASSLELKQTLQFHLRETEVHVTRLNEIIDQAKDIEAFTEKDAIITALVASAENIVKESEEGPVRDAGLLATAQKVEHYEIASYGAARDWAKLLGLDHHAELLQKTLNEEKRADDFLGAISQSAINSAPPVGS